MSGSSSSEGDEIVAVVALAAIARLSDRSTQNFSRASFPSREPNQERYFCINTQRMIDDYFIDDQHTRKDRGTGKRYSEAESERRFRMPRSVFNELFVVISIDGYFYESRDTTGKRGASALQKVVSALRQICYGLSADGVEKYTGLSESTSRQCLKRFCETVIQHFAKEYLRRPTADDLANIEAVYKSKGFPGCIGCLDCAGREWEMAPFAHQGRNKGKSRKSGIRMEVICDKSLWIWRVFFGCPGSFNDINILDSSPLSTDVVAENFPPSAPDIYIGGFKLGWYYWLVDGIYPRWSKFVTGYRDPADPTETMFYARQAAVRKSAERVFGVLSERFGILRHPSRFHYLGTMRSVLLTCVILHNMIVETRRGGYIGLDEEGNFGRQIPSVVRNIPKAHSAEERVEQWRQAAKTESTSFHLQLREALKRHIWRTGATSQP